MTIVIDAEDIVIKNDFNNSFREYNFIVRHTRTGSMPHKVPCQPTRTHLAIRNQS